MALFWSAFLAVTLILVCPAGSYATAEDDSDEPFAVPIEKTQMEIQLLELDQIRENAKGRRAPLPLPASLEKPVHVIFTFVDHWEPGDIEPGATNLAKYWNEDYFAMAKKHHDADGAMPQHTWFCAQLYSTNALRIIEGSCFKGLGEMEVHIHHGTSDDSAKDNTSEMESYIRFFLSTLNKYGACYTCEPNPKPYFAFIHGMWALDNSRLLNGVRQYCGVNRELDLLRKYNCYADFTFPAWGPMEPSWEGKIYAAKDSDEPKSYSIDGNIRELTVGGDRPASNELTIFEGPPGNTNIDRVDVPTLARMQDWVNSYVHVPGRNNWVFVKVYTHSAVNLESPDGPSVFMGNIADNFYRDIERQYNDGVNYKLHYATAREMWNIAMAAIDGKSGNPNDYRDYMIAKPPNRYFYSATPYTLVSYNPQNKEFLLNFPTPPQNLQFYTADPKIPFKIFEGDSARGPFHESDSTETSTLEHQDIFGDKTPSKFYYLLTPSAYEGHSCLSYP